MHDWLAHRVRVTPERDALVTTDSGNSWDYATLDETVEEMAGRLAGLGVEGGDHLGAVLGTCVEHVCLVHAAMRLGATLVPMSPEFTAPELRERFDRADVDAVVCDADTEQTVVEACTDTDGEESVFTIDDPQWTDVTSLSEAEPSVFTPGTWSRSDVQLLLFTSGTTGTPKVVQLTMGNLLASAVASAFRLGVVPGDRWLVPLSLHHMGGIAPILRSTLYGTTTVVRAEFDPGGTVDDIQSHDVTGVSLVPTMLRRMLEARGTLPDCLRFALVGGAPCPVELVERCRDFSVPIFPTYGMTETASQVATATAQEAYRAPDSVGRPLLWTDVAVVGDDGDPLPPGESGELVVSGPAVTPGYYRDPETTAAAMSEHGLHTGDVGYRDEAGRVHVLNRLDDRIITGGENVDPGEVLDALLAHPEVAEASVVGLPDEDWGERVGALVVPLEEEPLVGELETFLRDRIAGYKLPRTIGFANELPRTVSGTVEREAVRDRLVSGTTGFIEHAEAPLVRRESGDDEEAVDEPEGEVDDREAVSNKATDESPGEEAVEHDEGTPRAEDDAEGGTAGQADSDVDETAEPADGASRGDDTSKQAGDESRQNDGPAEEIGGSPDGRGDSTGETSDSAGGPADATELSTDAIQTSGDATGEVTDVTAEIQWAKGAEATVATAGATSTEEMNGDGGASDDGGDDGAGDGDDGEVDSGASGDDGGDDDGGTEDAGGDDAGDAEEPVEPPPGETFPSDEAVDDEE